MYVVKIGYLPEISQDSPFILVIFLIIFTIFNYFCF